MRTVYLSEQHSWPSLQINSILPRVVLNALLQGGELLVVPCHIPTTGIEYHHSAIIANAVVVDSARPSASLAASGSTVIVPIS